VSGLVGYGTVGGAAQVGVGDEEEQVAMMDLFQGAVGVFKNPTSHRQVNYADPHPCVRSRPLGRLAAPTAGSGARRLSASKVELARRRRWCWRPEPLHVQQLMVRAPTSSMIGRATALSLMRQRPSCRGLPVPSRLMGLKRQIERQDWISMPWVRLDQGGLETLEAELHKLGDVSIETEGYEPVETVAEVVQGQPARLDQLTMHAPAGRPWAGVEVQLGAKAVASIRRKDDTDATVLGFLALTDILRAYSRPSLVVVERRIQLTYWSSWGMLVGGLIKSLARSEFHYPAWVNILFYLIEAIVIAAMVVNAVLKLRRRTRVSFQADRTHWFHKNRDSLIIGTVTCFVAGLIVLLLTPLVVKG